MESGERKSENARWSLDVSRKCPIVGQIYEEVKLPFRKLPNWDRIVGICQAQNHGINHDYRRQRDVAIQGLINKNLNDYCHRQCVETASECLLCRKGVHRGRRWSSIAHGFLSSLVFQHPFVRNTSKKIPYPSMLQGKGELSHDAKNQYLE